MSARLFFPSTKQLSLLNKVVHGMHFSTKIRTLGPLVISTISPFQHQIWKVATTGIGPIQRDLSSAFLAAYLDPADISPSCARYQGYWEGREPGLRAAYEQASCAQRGA